MLITWIASSSNIFNTKVNITTYSENTPYLETVLVLGLTLVSMFLPFSPDMVMPFFPDMVMQRKQWRRSKAVAPNKRSQKLDRPPTYAGTPADKVPEACSSRVPMCANTQKPRKAWVAQKQNNRVYQENRGKPELHINKTTESTQGELEMEPKRQGGRSYLPLT